jgi:multicomponent Na+:H+ antiporter subunit D
MLNHAMMKGCLFLSAGGILFRTGGAEVGDYDGVARRLPVSAAAFAVAAAAIVGLPPTAGFFSKWYLLEATLAVGAWPFALALVVSSLLSAVYLFRVVERAYFGAPPGGVADAGGERTELPLRMLAPIALMAAAVLVTGLFSRGVVAHVIAFALPASNR